jgi:putative endonuclease
MKSPAVYILASRRNGRLYTGATSDLIGRTWQHKNHVLDGFSNKYQVTMLVYYEWFEEMNAAIEREKQIKAGSRKKKLALIEALNPEWRDLYFNLTS